MDAKPRNLIRASEIAALPEILFRHPRNSASGVHLRSLGRAAGLARLGLHLGRLAPGGESFVYHWHHFEEEFVYVISGRGMAEIGEETHEIGPGDVLLFGAPSVGHHLWNPFEEELTYLTGGESRELEVGEFPRHGERAIFEKGKEAYVVDVASTTPFRF
jgi:uncharacterized cupin superfamily protein